MDIMIKAKELGEAIAASRQMEVLSQCEINMKQDEKAQQLLNDYQTLQRELANQMEQRTEKEVLEEIKEILMAKQQELNEYTVTAAYIEARKNFDALVKTVNDVITFSITGEAPCSSTGCSTSGCSTCGGCSE